MSALVLALVLAAQASDAVAPSASAPSAVPTETTAVPAVERDVKRIAVMKTDVAGELDKALGPQITARLAEEIRTVTGAQVISSDEMIALLKHEKDRAILGECKDDESCIAELAQALGADVVVSAKLSKVEGAMSLAVSAVDAHTASVQGRVNESWGGDVVSLLALVRPVVVKLFATTSIPTGKIAVVGAIAGSRIFVDGEERGSAELSSIDALLIGGHKVVIQHPDRKAFERWVVVESGRVASVAVAQEGIDDGITSSIWFWTAAGGGVAVVGATVLLVAVALSGNRTGVNVQVNADETLEASRR